MPGYNKSGGSVFDRLYSTPTKSSALKSKRLINAADDDTASTTSKETPKSPSRTRTKKPNNVKAVTIHSSPTAKPKTRAPTISTTLWLAARDAVMSEPIALKPTALNLTSGIAQYEAGALTKTTLASNIITALFHRDFSTDEPDRWDDGSAEIEQTQCSNVFKCKKESTYDWKDIYSVASATATIRFEIDGIILIDDYSYYVAG